MSAGKICPLTPKFPYCCQFKYLVEKYEEFVALKKAQLKKSELTPLQLAVKDAQTRFISAAKRFKFIRHLGVTNHAETYNMLDDAMKDLMQKDFEEETICIALIQLEKVF